MLNVEWESSATIWQWKGERNVFVVCDLWWRLAQPLQLQRTSILNATIDRNILFTFRLENCWPYASGLPSDSGFTVNSPVLIKRNYVKRRRNDHTKPEWNGVPWMSSSAKQHMNSRCAFSMSSKWNENGTREKYSEQQIIIITYLFCCVPCITKWHLLLRECKIYGRHFLKLVASQKMTTFDFSRVCDFTLMTQSLFGSAQLAKFSPKLNLEWRKRHSGFCIDGRWRPIKWCPWKFLVVPGVQIWKFPS